MRTLLALPLLLGCSAAAPMAADDAGNPASADAAAPDAVATNVTDAAKSDSGPQASTPAGVQVLFPPTSGPDYASVKQYLMTNAAVAGAVINVAWSDFDLGSGKYDFTIPDATIAEWVAAGKKVQLTIENTPYGGSTCPSSGSGSRGTSGVGNCDMPPWVWAALGSANVTTCTSPTGSQQAANFRASVFIDAYESAIKAFLAHYGSNPSVGYIRIGLGKGGEINLPTGWNDTTTSCGQAYTTAWGYTVGTTASATWNQYLQEMVQWEGAQKSPKPLLVSMTPVTGSASSNDVPDFLAPIAAAAGVGIGNQGLQYSDTTNYPHCGGDWCADFSKYTGQVLLQLQTLGQSCPAGAGQCPGTSATEKLANSTGSLVPLLPFAVQHHADTLEIYYQDWLIAFDPSNPNHAMYGAAYASALQTAASTIQ